MDEEEKKEIRTCLKKHWGWLRREENYNTTYRFLMSHIERAEKLINIKYGCGHKGQPVILGDNPLSVSAYLEWCETRGYNGNKTQCWECWCKNKTS